MPAHPTSQQWQKAEPAHRSLSQHRRGLAVPLRWRPAHGRSGSIQTHVTMPSLRWASKGKSVCRPTACPESRRSQCSVEQRLRWVESQLTQRQCRLCAGAQSQMQEAVLAPAASQHVPVASVCLQAAPPNAQCVQAGCRKARCLTLQSRGQTTAGQALLLLPTHSRRCLPLISNVRHRVSQRAVPRSLSACLRTWATPQRAVRPASLAASAPAAVLDASSLRASARAARPLASGVPPELLATKVQSGVVASRETCWPGSFQSRGLGVARFTRRAAQASTLQVRGRSPLSYPAPSLSALEATQSTAAFGSAVRVGVCSVALARSASKIKAISTHPGSLPNLAINRTAFGSRLSLR